MKTSRNSLIPFFLISLGLHVAFFTSWPNAAPEIKKFREPIPVAFMPFPEEKKIEPLREIKSQEPVAKVAKIKPQKLKIARKPTPLPAAPTPQPKRDKIQPRKPKPPPLQVRKRETIVNRPLPSIKELLPSFKWSQSQEKEEFEEGAVRLDTQEPKYISYLSSVKRAIELEWEYPDMALRHGLQGKLVLEFIIHGDGNLMRTRIIRSSGFSMLDEEAVRSVQTAAPFHPIPPWIGKSRLPIIASFEYLDNRLNYSFAP
ncbi:MAG: energy transducer TonB [Candidatus Binatia bacterium]